MWSISGEEMWLGNNNTNNDTKTVYEHLGLNPEKVNKYIDDKEVIDKVYNFLKKYSYENRGDWEFIDKGQNHFGIKDDYYGIIIIFKRSKKRCRKEEKDSLSRLLSKYWKTKE